MTVCIAAICQSNGHEMIIGATDRQLTSGDIQFEPRTAKIWELDCGILALGAGDIAAQSEICIKTSMRQCYSVDKTVHVYCHELGTYNRRQAERKFLVPLGLTMRKFVDAQQHLSGEFVEQIRREIWQDRAKVQAIVCGMDKNGPHIYLIDDSGHAFSKSGIGFCAIGDGGRHASSQFMFVKYDRTWTLATAALLVYAAKKRAEVAPGVGAETDLFYIIKTAVNMPAAHGFILDPMMQAIITAYNDQQIAQTTALKESYEKIDAFVESWMQSAYQQQVRDQPPDAPQAGNP